MSKKCVGFFGPRSGAARRGFALVTVIWGLSIVALLIVSFMSSARLQLQTAYNLAGAAKAELLADAALNAAFMSVLAERESAGVNLGLRPPHDGAPRFCALDGAAVVIALEEETGKIDLNAAAPKLLQTMIMGLGVERSEAETLTAAILAFRSVEQGRAGQGESGASVAAKHALFQSVLELDQVSGMTPELFAAAQSLVTVHSRSPGVDRRSAPPALFAALAGLPPGEVAALLQTPFPNTLDRNDPRFPQTFNQQIGSGAMLAHVEVLLPAGQSGAREAVYDFTDGRGPDYALKESRRGVARYLDALRAMVRSGGAPEC